MGTIVQSAMHLTGKGEAPEGVTPYQPKKEKKAKSEQKQKSDISDTRAHAQEEECERIQIREDKRNYRRHSDKNLSLIGKSLDDFGAGRSIVADNSGQVIGGNGTLREANKRGIPQRIIHTNGDELVVVVRDDIAPDDPRRQKLAIMDNSTTDTSDFDLMLLQEDFSIPELDDMGIDIDDDMLADEYVADGETKADAVPDVEEAAITERGKVYQLGKHQLMCGDSTSAEDVALLMNGEKADLLLTDPPYGINFDKVITKKYTVIQQGFINSDTEKRVHPTQKPVELLCKMLPDYSQPENIVIDLFGGLGSTLIACEQTNRQCRMMELDPHYCDVIRKRWAEFVHGAGCDWRSLTPEV
jgi:hypothetical protein